MTNSLGLDRSLAEARASLEAGNLEQADIHCSAALELDPAHVEASLMRGVVAARRGEAGAAIEVFRAVLERDPDRWEANDWLCVLLCRAGDAHEAYGFGRRALKLR